MKAAYNYLLFIVIFMANSVFGQTGIVPADDAPIKLDCPQFPLYDSWDRNCLIKTAEPYGEIRLPQAGVDGLNLESPMWLVLPNNKPGWALGIAHAWNLHRNYIKKINYPKISYYLGILGIETGMACTCEAKFDSTAWPWTSLRFDNWNTKCQFSNPHEGCFQMEEYNAWGQLNQILPYRFPCEGFNNNIPAHRFETQAIALTYRNVYNHMTLEYSWNTRLWEIIENPACDPYAYEKILAVGWNSWIGGIYQNIAGLYDPQVNFYTGRAVAATHDCWDLAGQFGFYPDVLGWNMAVLEGNTSYCQYQYPVLSQQNNKPAGTQNHVQLANFDCLFQWSDVSAYIDTVCNFYFEYSMAVDPVKNAAVKARVKAVFDQLGGGGTVNFKRMGPVVDELILAFPKEVPLMGSLHDDATPNGYRGNWFSRCPGNYAPASHIENRNLKKDTICIGQTLVAAAVIDGGEGPNLKYKWSVNGVVQVGATDSLFNFSSNTIGDYIINLNVCDPKEGGCADANCFMRIHVSDCKVCNLLATSTSVNTPCQNTPKGIINLNVVGSTSYTVKYEGPYGGTIDGSGAMTSITGLVDGVYNITITDKADPSCKFLLSQEVKYDVPMNNKLTASIQNLNDCDAKLKAVIEQTNCHCDYTVNMEEISPDRWERYVFFDIIPSTGGYETFRGNVFQNTNTVVSKKFSLCTGDKLKVEGHILPASGSCDPRRTDAVNRQVSRYQVWLVGPDGVEIRRDTIKPGAIQQLTDYFVFEHTINCPFTPDPYTYLWMPGNLTGTPLTVTESKYIDKTYTVIATNTLHPLCTLKDTVLVPFKCRVDCIKPDSSVITPGSLSLCKDSVLTFKGNRLQGYEYRWYKDGLLQKSGLEEYDFSSTGKGNYQLVITDTVSPNDSLCMAISDTSKLQIYSSPEISGLLIDKTVCEGLDAQFNELKNFSDGNGPYQYMWQDTSVEDTFGIAAVSSTDPFISGGGKVFVELKNKYGCVARDTALLKVSTALLLNIKSSDTDKELCAGDSLILSEANFKKSNGYNFLWQNGAGSNETYVVKTAGKYTLQIEKNGCKGDADIDIKVNSLPVITMPDTYSVCNGDSLSIAATVPNGVTLLWENGKSTSSVFVKNAGKYIVEATNITTQCKNQDTAILSVSALPDFTFASHSLLACTGTTSNLAPVPLLAGMNYLWSNNANTQNINVTSSGKYWLKISDPTTLCFHSDTVDVEYIDKPVVTLGKDTIVCESGLDLNAGYANKPNVTYLWSTGQTSRSIYVTDQGTYFVKVSIGSCSASDTIEVKVESTPASTLKSTDLGELTPCFEMERNHVLTANDDPNLIYTWFINGTLSNEKSNTIGVFREGKYEVFISNGICPVVKDNIKVKEYCPTNFYVPNAMIIGRVGENGSFKVYGNVPTNQYSMMIFNRWGELIFESYNPDDVWDGTYNNHPVQQDVYVWKITYMENKVTGGQLLNSKIGHVTVLGN